ncbi:MAG: glycosyltransferase family 2 protein, partial [Pseudomonadota bacterium]
LGHIQILIRPEGAGPQTKPAALNYGLARSFGSIVGIYDAEDRPEREQLAVIARVMQADPRIQCVQAYLNYHNREETFITRMFALEYSLHFDYVLPGLLKLGLPIPLGGTSNFIRRPMLEKLGGWDAHNVTEDADLGLRLAEAGGRMAMASSTTYEEATEGPGPWIKQRSRWLKGYLQTWLVHTRRPMSLRTSIVLHGMLGAVVLNALAIPVTTLMFAAWWLTEWALVEAIFGGMLKFPSYFLLVGGNFIHAWLLAMAPLRRGWFGLSTEVFLLPLYWVLQSAAAYRALFGLMRNPSYWSKTDHSAGADPIRDVFHA